MLLAGDPGIGKTRLLAETAVRAFASGAIVLAGRAPEETLVPYQPFLEALGHYVFRAPLEELRVVAREYGAELGRLIPALRRRVPELPPPDPGDPETDRYRLFEAVAGLLAEISAAVPVLIVLDDLQWADRPTLLLLRHLARSPQNTRVSIMGAYRDVDQWSEGFDAALAGLRRERLMVQIDVGGLPEAEAIELVRLRAGGTPSLAFVQALYRETEGNPFFIEEIVRHLTDAGVRSQDAGARDLERVGLPEDVRDVISRRLDRLAPGSIEWLRVAAVIGRDFDSALLERVLGFDEDRFLSALEDALDAGLVAEAPGDPGRYSFAHALIRETLYEGMSSARRARVHRRVGVALEESDPALPGEPDRRARPALHARRRPRGLRAGDPLRPARRRAGDGDAGQRGGGRALLAGAGGARPLGPGGAAAALRPAAGAGGGPGAQRRAPAGVGDLPRGGGAGRGAGRQGLAGSGGDRRLPALRAAAGRRRRGAHRAARAGRRHDRRRAHRHPGAAAGAAVRRAVLL